MGGLPNMHSKRQQLLFFLIIDKYIDNLFLDRVLQKLDKEIPQDERQKIQERVDETELDQEENTLLLLTLFYCLHVQVPKPGHMAMLTKELIKKSHIKFDSENIKETNKLLRETMEQIGIPLEREEGKKPRYIENIEYYADDFLRKYPNVSA